MWSLGRYQLNEASFALLLNGEPLALQRRPFDLLLYLVTRRNQVVAREELLEEVWGGVAVAAGAVSTAIYEVRAAIGDLQRGSADRWVETVRGRGFRFRGPATYSEDSSVSSDRLPFVGRRKLIAALGQKIDRARSGQGSVQLVDAPAGMGKSRLLLEIAARHPEMRSHTVFCEPNGPPLWPWTQLERLLSDMRDTGDALGRVSSAAGRSDERVAVLHFQRVDAFGELLASAASTGPLLIAVEDLHWADPSSLALLQSLAPRLAALPVVIIATERGDDQVSTPGHGLHGSPHAETWHLEPLTIEHLFPLIQAIIGRVPSPELVAWIQTHSQGVPLMVHELAERIVREGESVIDVPKLAGRVFARRFETLGEESRLAIGIAALCGNRFDAPLVEAAAGETFPAERTWIREGLEAGILIGQRDHPLRFSFRHALLRDAAEGLLDPSVVPLWHERIRMAIERQHPHPTGATLSQLARHSAASAFGSSGLEGPLRYALMAARRAVKVFDWTEVGIHTANVLNWIDYQAPTPARGKQEVEAALLRCASIAHLSGHVEETETLLERIEPLLDVGADASSRALAAAFRFANARRSGDYALALMHTADLDGAESLGEAATCWRVGLASIGGEFRAATAEPSWGRELPADPAFREYAQRCGRDPGIECLSLSAFAYWAVGQDRVAVERAERAVSWAESSGDARGRIWALVLLCLLHTVRDDWAALRRLGPEIDRASARDRVAPWLGLGTGLDFWASRRQRDDRSPGIETLASVLLDRARSSSAALRTPLFLLAGRVYAWAGDHPNAELAVRDGIAFCERSDERFLQAEILRLLGKVLTRQGNDAEACEVRRRGISIARTQHHVVSEIRTLADLARSGFATVAERERLEALGDEFASTLGNGELALVAPALDPQ